MEPMKNHQKLVALRPETWILSMFLRIGFRKPEILSFAKFTAISKEDANK